MNNDILKKLIEKLMKRTASGELVWSKTSGQNEFKVMFSSSAITVDKYRSKDDEPYNYDLIVYNDQGDPIDRVVYDTDPLAFNLPDTKLIIDLYDVAVKGYYKVDKTYDDLFKELGD